MATNVRSNAYVYRHDNYTTAASGSVATKTPTAAIDYLFISNTHATNGAKVSFDGGNTFLTIAAGTYLELFPAKMVSYMVEDAVDNSHATLQCLYGSES